jgi:hypothetical protein
MADIAVDSTAAGTNTGTSWANAYLALKTATDAATSSDTIWVYNAQNETGLAATTYLLSGCRIISTSDRANFPPTSSAAGASVQTSGTAILTVTGNGRIVGLTLKGGSSSSATNLVIAGADNSSLDLEDCTLQNASTSATARIVIGIASATNANMKVRTRNCTFVFGHASQGITIFSDWEDTGGTYAVSGSVPTTLFVPSSLGSSVFNGANFSTISGTLFAASVCWYQARLANCRLNASVTVQGALTVDASSEIWLFDSAAGDVHYNFAHYAWRGSTTVSTAIYPTSGLTYDGTNRMSIVVSGSANASRANPYYSPWIDQRGDAQVGTTLDLWLECARDGSATKYTDAEVWAEMLVKGDAGFSNTVLITDRANHAAAGTAQATGTVTWTGLGGTNCLMKISPAAVTIDEIGYVRARVAIAVNGTVYVSPQIYGL